MVHPFLIECPEVMEYKSQTSFGAVEAYRLTCAARRSFSLLSCKSGVSNFIRVPQQALARIRILFFLEQ
jgi:hypothetical protein